MPDPVEVVIESALLDSFVALATSLTLPYSVPNVPTDPPVAGPGVCWLRATFLPAASYSLSVGYQSDAQHQGILQVDVFRYPGDGELAIGRVASQVIAWFDRGTKLSKTGVTVSVERKPYRSRLRSDDPWVVISVSVPYQTFSP